jgi:hypothetical protein
MLTVKRIMEPRCGHESPAVRDPCSRRTGNKALATGAKLFGHPRTESIDNAFLQKVQAFVRTAAARR